MKAKGTVKNKVNVITLGCSKNLVDSEVLMGQLKANEFNVSHESDDNESNIIIINTCGFIDNAKQESIDTILRYAAEKESGNIDKLYVTGCLSERYKPQLESEIPQVDAFFGTRELPRLLKTLKADYRKELLGERLLTTPRHYAYLKISEGCDRPCSFCAIPLMRGGHVSVPVEELVKQAGNLAKQGTKELLLIAQDSTYYGLDLYKKRNLAELLDRLSDVPGIEWIRLHYAFPAGFPDDVLDIINSKPNICRYLDMPLQHINNEMLKSMKRGTTRERTNELIEKIRYKIPGITLRTTLIAGYPGETKEMHLEMADWIKEIRFDRLGIFAYSHEENTGAGQLKDTVSSSEKQKRVNRIMEIQQEISFELNQNKLGKIMKVVLDKSEGNYVIGRSEADSPEVDNEVLIERSLLPDFKPGTFVQAEIIEAGDYDLYARPVK